VLHGRSLFPNTQGEALADTFSRRNLLPSLTRHTEGVRASCRPRAPRSPASSLASRHPGWSAPPADHPTQVSTSNARRRRTNGETETDVWEGLRSSRSFRSFFRTSPVRVTALRPERRKVAGPRARSPACVCGSTTEVVHSFSTARWGMNDGPELPGEFVSDELRNDCARFLDELRRLVELRHQPAPESAAWAPRRFSDPQAPPNSRSPQSRQ
jgi:hypothetical protein